MAKGVINLQKESGGVTKITSTDGTGITELVLPESGNIVSIEGSVTDNAIARYDSTTGKLQDSGVVIDDNGNVGVNTLISNWNLSSKNVEINNVSISSGSIHSGAANAIYGNNFYTNTSGLDIYKTTSIANKYQQGINGHSFLSAPSGTAGAPIVWSSSMILNSVGDLLLTSGTGALGYGAGAGGTVTQLTSKSTSVTLNKPCGQITMNNASLAAGATVGFALNNNLIGANDKVEVEAMLSSVIYNAYVYYSTTGAAYIAVENKSGTTRTDAVVIKFAILKGATS